MGTVIVLLIFIIRVVFWEWIMFSECSRHGNLMLTGLLYLQVNTIAWNESGEYLLSGADDCHLNIYRPSNRQVTYSLLVHLITFV